MSGIHVKDLSFSYGPKQALDGVGFRVEAGQFCALLGPNGAGKSTLMALLTGLITSRSGLIEIAGEDLRQNPRKALSKLGVVFQQPTLDLDLSAMGNLRYFAALQGIGRKQATERATAALDQMGMLERAHEKVRAMNGGHRRRVEIARALLHDPQVLLLDEPTVGLDVASRLSLVAHVHELAATRGMAVLWTTHLTDEVLPQDQVVILHRGKLLRNSTYDILTYQEPLSDMFLTLTGGAT